jgi:hypothetical protein
MPNQPRFRWLHALARELIGKSVTPGWTPTQMGSILPIVRSCTPAMALRYKRILAAFALPAEAICDRR